MRKRNKWLKAMSIALSCAVLATTAPMNMFATEVNVVAEATNVQEGTCGDNATYTQDSEGLLTISGTGLIASSSFADYWTSIKKVVIEDGITGIGNSVFLGCSNLESVVIPESVTSLGEFVFYECENLVNIELPNKLELLEQGVFGGCSSLESIVIPEGVRGIEYFAFGNCSSLKSVSIPVSVDNIDSKAFIDCTNLSDIYYAGTEAQWNEIKEMNGETWGIPDTATIHYESELPNDGTESEKNYCGDNATYTLDENGLLTISGTGEIDDYAFEENEDIKKVVIEDGITSIGNEVFVDSTITSITIPSSVSNIGNLAFYFCYDLTKINVSEANEYYKSIDGVLFNKAGDTLICCPIGKSGDTYTVPEGVTTIKNNAFTECNFTTVKLPNSLVKIEDHAFMYTSFTEITIPSKVTTIGTGAFWDSSLTSIIIPTSVTTIGANAFPYDFPDIYYTGTEEEWNKISVGEYPGQEKTIIHYNTKVEEPEDTTTPDDDTNKPEDDTNNSDTSYEVTLPADKTTISALDFATVLEANKTQDVVIKSNNNITFTFAKGTMANVDGMENYDFGSSVVSDFANAGNMGSTVTKDNFVTRINYNYSGKLPATAEIKIYVGTNYAEGTTLYYSKMVEDGFKLIQSVKVDKDGYITISQDSCSDYVVTTNDLTVTTPEDTQKPEDDTSTPEDTTTPEDDKTEEAPKTGDNANIFVYVTMLVCGVGAVLMAMQKKLSR